MKKYLLFMLGFVCCWSCAVCEDASSSIGQFSEDEYVILSLSDDQIEEVESLRRITLSKAQLSELRNLAPAFPKRIGVASPFVSDIADSRFSPWPEQITGIWYCKDAVAIPRDSLNGSGGYREFSKCLNAGDAVLIDTKGGYGIGPRNVSREKLADMLAALGRKEPEGKRFHIFILRPPVLDREDEQEVQRSIDELARLSRERGVDCRFGG